MLKLLIEDDEGQTTIVPLVRDSVTIGRKEGNTIRLTERNVSRRHAVLQVSNGAIQIQDLDSYNGTKVNGERIQGTHNLAEGDLIEIGDYHLAIKSDAGDQSQDTMRMPHARQAAATAPERAGSGPQFQAVQAPGMPQFPLPGSPGGMASPVPGPSPFAPSAISSAPTVIRQVRPAGPSPSGPSPAIASSPVGQDEATAVIRPPMVAQVAQPGMGMPLIGVSATLTGMSHQFEGQEFEISRSPAVAGRTTENDIALDHRSISRHHAQFVFEGGKFYIQDLNSANGVLVNGEQYARSALKDGDTVELGHLKFRFHTEGVADEGGTHEPTSVIRLAHMQPKAADDDATVELPSMKTMPAEDEFAPPAAASQTKLYIAIAVAVATLAVGGLYKLASAPKAPAAPPPVAVPETSQLELLEAAKKDVATRNYADAEIKLAAFLAKNTGHTEAESLFETARSETKNQRRIEEAKRFIGESDFERALDALKEFPAGSAFTEEATSLRAQAAKGSIDSHMKKAVEFRESQEYDKALTELDAVLFLDDQHQAAMEERVAILKIMDGGGEEKKTAKAAGPPKTAKPPKEIVQGPPSDPFAGKSAADLIEMGNKLYLSGKVEDAVAAFKAAIGANPNNCMAYRNLGSAYAKLKQTPKAVAAYKKYVQLCPDKPDAAQVKKMVDNYAAKGGK